MNKSTKIAFIDRDGVINVDSGYVYCWSDFRIIPGVIDGLILLNKIGYLPVIVTNQSGIARGMYSYSQYRELTAKYVEYLRNKGAYILDVVCCPHHPDGIVKMYAVNCQCRKPKPGLLLSLSNKYGIDYKNSIMIGDKETDIQAGRSAGVGICIRIGDEVCSAADVVCKSLFDAVLRISNVVSDK